ncbi:Octopamine receptor [Holothuria leucospilota]|uniref:Octopamine receptor n=1 Tax=Holothuria leucospilota TaxID=206669 RepID=A0A9Q1CKC4_HOLLE|nr:Octopamine receptor [Holothuria leucospilota]
MIGVPGNILVLKVYLGKARKSSTFVFISFMAISDLILCSVASLLHVGFILATAHLAKGILCKIVYFIMVTFFLLSLSTSAVVGIDRYVAVCRPYSKRLSVRTSVILATLCAMFSVTFAMPPVFAVNLSSGEYDFVSCKKGSDTGLFETVSHSSSYLVIVLLLATTILCYTLAWRSLRAHRIVSKLSVHNKMTSNTSKKQEKSVNTTMNDHERHHDSSDTKLEEKSFPVLSNAIDIKRKDQGESSHSSSALQEESILSTDNQMRRSSHPVSIGEVSSQMHHHKCQTTKDDNVKSITKSSDLTEGQNLSSVPTSSNREPSKMTMAVQRRITLMLFLTTVITLSTMPVMLITRLLPDVVLNDIKHSSEILFVLISVAQYIGFINNAINPFIYSLFDKRFRSECLKTFKRV